MLNTVVKGIARDLGAAASFCKLEKTRELYHFSLLFAKEAKTEDCCCGQRERERDLSISKHAVHAACCHQFSLMLKKIVGEATAQT